MNSHKERIYLDYAASTPVDPLVFDAMKPYFSVKFGNPGSLHSFGQEAVAALDAARETIAKAIGAEFREIVFTGSATEANNLALRGTLRTARGLMQKGVRVGPRLRIIVSAIEHESILETARDLEKEGVEVVCLPVRENGVVDLRALESSLDDRTVLVSVMHANNEIGTVQPIAEIAKMISKFRNDKLSTSRHLDISKSPLYPLFHTDAAQAFQFLDCNVNLPDGGLGVDLMTLSAHKIYGPKGAGCLYMSQRPAAIITGGGQEFGMRSGTENVPSIVGFAKAASLAAALREKESNRIMGLRERLWRGIKKIIPKAEINGMPPHRSSAHGRLLSLPNILNVYFPGREAQDILTRMDLQGVAVSSGSACRARALEPSYVVRAIGYSEERAKSSIRFSLGRPTTKKEIDVTVRVLRKIL